jgi:hypothetical protein
MTHDVFICHSSKDRTIANAIVSVLEQHRIRCWIAPRDVVPGRDYAGAIVEAITGSKLTVLVFSGNSNQSQHVRREIERTVSRGIAVLPFRVEDVVPSPSLEYFISDAHWLDAMTPPLEQHLDHLVGTVRLLLERDAPAAPPASGEPPAPDQLAAGSYATGPRRRPAWQWAALGIGGVAAVVLAGMIVLPRLAGPAGTATPSPIPIATVTLLDLTGNGRKDSQRFTPTAAWTIRYTFDCSTFGYPGIFQVYVWRGSSDLVGVGVDELALSGSSSTTQYATGDVHLQVNSLCDWHVIVTEP